VEEARWAPHKAAHGEEGRWGEMAPGSLTSATKLAPAAAGDGILASVSAGSSLGLGGEEPAAGLLAVLEGDLKNLASACVRQICR